MDTIGTFRDTEPMWLKRMQVIIDKHVQAQQHDVDKNEKDDVLTEFDEDSRSGFQHKRYFAVDDPII